MAKVYSVLEYMTCGRALKQSREFHLNGCMPFERILILGDGNGRFLHGLFASGFKGEVVSIDCSQGMIEEAKRRCLHYADRIKWIEGRLEQVSLDELGRFDCLITHYFWDVFEAEKGRRLVEKTLQEIEGLFRVGMADFCEPEELSGWRQMRQRGLLWILFFCFRMVTGIENRKMWSMDGVLERSGWSSVERETFGNQMVWSGWWHQDSCIKGEDL